MLSRVPWRTDFGADVFIARRRRNACLSMLISDHKAYFAKLRERTESASERERNARSQIIAYEPHDRREALERLSYLFAVVATANDWFDDNEMEELLTMIRNY